MMKLLIMLLGLNYAMIIYLKVGQAVSEKHLLKGLYVHYIDPQVKAMITRDLLLLNSRGYGEVVKFQGTLPVYIFNVPEKEMVIKGALAEARTSTFGCIIKLNKEVWYLKETLYHELLHCYYYDHVDNPIDIMYYQMNDELRLDTIDPYLEEIQALNE